MRYVAIRSEGGLLPYDLLDKIAAEDAVGQKASEFGLPKGRRLNDEISRVWTDAQDLWNIFKRRRETLSDKDPYGTTLTRDRWILPLLSDADMLGFDLKFQPSAVVINRSTYPVSHRAGDGENAPPVHIEGFKIDVDRRLHTKLRTSPQAMVQDYLNNSEQALWGIITNGIVFRREAEYVQLVRGVNDLACDTKGPCWHYRAHRNSNGRQ